MQLGRAERPHINPKNNSCPGGAVETSWRNPSLPQVRCFPRPCRELPGLPGTGVAGRQGGRASASSPGCFSQGSCCCQASLLLAVAFTFVFSSRGWGWACPCWKQFKLLLIQRGARIPSCEALLVLMFSGVQKERQFLQ